MIIDSLMIINSLKINKVLWNNEYSNFLFNELKMKIDSLIDLKSYKFKDLKHLKYQSIISDTDKTHGL
jgi:hypothetical protein